MASAADVQAPGAERRVFWAAALVTVVLDLITKLVAEATLLRTPGISVVGDWFQLRLVYNQGAAFGLHVGPYSRWIFFAVALVAVFVLARMSKSAPAGDRFRQLARRGKRGQPGQLFDDGGELERAERPCVRRGGAGVSGGRCVGHR